jgi:hypothetical protein
MYNKLDKLKIFYLSVSGAIIVPVTITTIWRATPVLKAIIFWSEHSIAITVLTFNLI